MSASTVVPINRETIYERLIKDFLMGGNNLLLEKFFALGKGWNTDEKHFQYLYLSLLCNFNCDVSYYFNEKIKAILDVSNSTKIPYETQISNLSNEYNQWVTDGNAGDFVTFLLSQLDIDASVNWQEIGW